MLRLMREHRRARDIADRVDALHIRAAEIVDDDRAALRLHAELLEAEILDIAGDADRRDQALGRDGDARALGILDMGSDAILRLLDLRHLGAREYLDAGFLEAFAGMGRDLRILDRKDLRQELDDRHLRAHVAEEGCEFDADRARAHDEERLRDRWRHHRLEIGPDQLAVRLDARENARPRARRDDDVLGFVVARCPMSLSARGERAASGASSRRRP